MGTCHYHIKLEGVDILKGNWVCIVMHVKSLIQSVPDKSVVCGQSLLPSPPQANSEGTVKSICIHLSPQYCYNFALSYWSNWEELAPNCSSSDAAAIAVYRKPCCSAYKPSSLAATTFSLHAQETSDQKTFLLETSFFRKRQKPVVCRKYVSKLYARML